jgi:tetratricopeptide (TPR) repeat protein
MYGSGPYRRGIYGLVLAAVWALTACQAQKQAEVELVPGSPAVEQTYQEGRALFEAGMYGKAAEEFARVVAADPKHFKALVNWGAALSRSHRPAEAIPKFQQALSLDPEHPNRAEAYYDWGVALERLGEHREAVEKFKQALALKPGLLTASLESYLQRHQPQRRDTQIETPLGQPPAPQQP